MKDGLEDQTEIIAGLEAKVREQAAVIAELEGRLKEMQATEAARPQYSLGVLEFAERMVVEAGKEAAIAEAWLKEDGFFGSESEAGPGDAAPELNLGL